MHCRRLLFNMHSSSSSRERSASFWAALILQAQSRSEESGTRHKGTLPLAVRWPPGRAGLGQLLWQPVEAAIRYAHSQSLQHFLPKRSCTHSPGGCFITLLKNIIYFEAFFSLFHNHILTEFKNIGF